MLLAAFAAIAAATIVGALGSGGGDGEAPSPRAGQSGEQRAQAKQKQKKDKKERPKRQAEADQPAPAPAPAEEQPQPQEEQPASGSLSGAELNDQGYSLMQQGRFDEAIPILQQAVDSFPSGTSDITYAYALFNLGSSLRQAGRADEAIPILEQRLQIPNQPGVVRRELELARSQAGQG